MRESKNAKNVKTYYSITFFAKNSIPFLYMQKILILITQNCNFFLQFCDLAINHNSCGKNAYNGNFLQFLGLSDMEMYVISVKNAICNSRGSVILCDNFRELINRHFCY